MKKYVKRLLSVVLSLCIALSAVIVVFGSDGEYDGKLIILHTNDVHGAIDRYCFVAGIKKDFEEKGAEVILADAGDYTQGTAYVGFSKGSSAVTMMNAAGYDVAVIGNHEFDYGYESLIEKMKSAQFNVVCANVLNDSGLLFEENFIYTSKNGVKIGFFGLDSPETKTQTNPTMVKGLSFLQNEELYAAAEEQVDKLSDTDIVIALTHMGVDKHSAPNRSVDLYKNVPGIDFIIDGHSHTVMTEGENGEPVQSTGTGLNNIGVIVIDSETKEIEDNYLMPVTDESPCDENIKALSDGIIAEVDREYSEVFAKSDVELNGDKAPGNRTTETNLGDLITDAMLWFVLGNDTAIEVPKSRVIAISNGGGIRAWIHKGDITKKDINTVLPFGNTVAVVYITGEELLEALEASTFTLPDAIPAFPQISGFRYTVRTYKEYKANEEAYPDSTYYGPASINRVQINDIGGRRFDRKAVYAVVTNDFCAAGGDTYYAFASAEKKYDTGIPLDEVLMSYITEECGGVIGEKYLEPQGRVTLINSAEDDTPPIIMFFKNIIQYFITAILQIISMIKL